MNILITGGYGFVGSALVDLLSVKDHRVVILDNLLSGQPYALSSNIQFMYGDIRDYRLMQAIVPTFDVVVHLAAIVGEPACVVDTNFAYDVNVEGTLNIISALRANQLIIFTSTSSVYGNRPYEVVTEASQPKPINNYARHKYQSELDIQYRNTNHIIVRPVTAFGITERTRLDLLVNTLIYNALSYGKIDVFEPDIMRPIIHVIDFARILLAAIDGDLGTNQVYNIGDPTYNMTKLELAKEVAMLCGAQVVQTDGKSLDPRDYDVSFERLIDTGFVFGNNRLSLAVQQIKAAQYKIAENPEAFSTPYKVKEYLKKESY